MSNLRLFVGVLVVFLDVFTLGVLATLVVQTLADAAAVVSLAIVLVAMIAVVGRSWIATRSRRTPYW